MTSMSSTSLNALASVKEKVGGYGGYGDSVTRRQSDKTIRLYLSGKIKELLKEFNADYIVPEEKDRDRLDSLVNSTKRKLLTVLLSLKSPTYIQELALESSVWQTHQFARIYELEKNMMDEVENIGVELSDLFQNGKAHASFEEHFLHIDTFVDNINQALFEREALFLGDD